ncbi:hypothetical protein T12_15630 [Trichinella patagoniensis]|uniref:Uncharacterized protein n=1 Tax=Trichinella patagoniensis TaxID=990121 RepID=A0A0V0Z7L2_9BILA|nr:hypothetical protein T12_15630 [Trichinella patagoniensis]
MKSEIDSPFPVFANVKHCVLRKFQKTEVRNVPSKYLQSFQRTCRNARLVKFNQLKDWFASFSRTINAFISLRKEQHIRVRIRIL